MSDERIGGPDPLLGEFGATLRQALAAAVRERAFQLWKYPQPAPRSVSSHVLVMEQELFEARCDAVKGSRNREAALAEVLQVVACGLACLMENGVAERAYVPEMVRHDADLSAGTAARLHREYQLSLARGLDLVGPEYPGPPG